MGHWGQGSPYDTTTSSFFPKHAGHITYAQNANVIVSFRTCRGADAAAGANMPEPPMRNLMMAALCAAVWVWSAEAPNGYSTRGPVYIIMNREHTITAKPGFPRDTAASMRASLTAAPSGSHHEAGFRTLEHAQTGFSRADGETLSVRASNCSVPMRLLTPLSPPRRSERVRMTPFSHTPWTRSTRCHASTAI